MLALLCNLIISGFWLVLGLFNTVSYFRPTARRVPPQKLVKAYVELNRYLQDLINSIHTNPLSVQDKSWPHRTLGMPPDLQGQNRTTFYRGLRYFLSMPHALVHIDD